MQDDKVIGDKPMIIQPPLPPQHVYAPMPALGALSIGFLSKKKEKKEDADFRLITNGIAPAIILSQFSPTLNHMNCSIAACLVTLFEIFILCPKIQLWFPEKIVVFWGWKTRENVVVLDFLAVDNFDFTRKSVKKNLGENVGIFF